MTLILIGALAGAAALLFLAGRVLMRRHRVRAARKRARGPLPPAAKRVQGEARVLLGRPRRADRGHQEDQLPTERRGN